MGSNTPGKFRGASQADIAQTAGTNPYFAQMREKARTMTTETLITEIPANDIAQLKQGAGEAIADLNTPGWREQAIRAQHVAAAREIIAGIPALLRDKGPYCYRTVTLMALERKDFKDAVRHNEEEWNADNLKNVAAIVFQACKDAGLDPVFANFRDGRGHNYEIQLPFAQQRKE